MSLDLHEHKVKLIKQAAKRLNLTHIEAKALDARKASDHYDDASFDRILIDAPCSGFGVIRRKPDMKYTKSSEDSARLATIQQSILHETAQLLKPGGTLVYSTCTMDPTENQQVIHAFYKNTKTSNPIYLLMNGCLSRLLRLFKTEVYKYFLIISEQMVSLFAA